MLRRKLKRRYIAIRHGGKDVDSLSRISERCAELFGQITLGKAGLRLMRSYGNIMIVRCGLGQVHELLVCIALVDPAMVATDMSGSIHRLRKRIPHSGSVPLHEPLAK